MSDTLPSDHQPVVTETTPRPKSRLGTAALWVGIIGIVFALIPHVGGFGVFLGIVALVLGVIGVRRRSRRALAGAIVGGAAILLGSIVLGTSGGPAGTASPAAAPASSKAAAAPAAASDDKSAAPTAAAKPAAPKGTIGQLQAATAAKGYLDSGMGFSAASLLQQLTSSAGNGFAQADAQWAVDHSGADWNAQALAAAKGYLESGMGFSAASLNGQLTSSAGNQFTPEQAQYAVAHAGADWNAQAVDAAKGYMDSGMGFSRSSLIEQLTSSAGNQFTQPQAEQAATAVGL